MDDSEAKKNALESQKGLPEHVQQHLYAAAIDPELSYEEFLQKLRKLGQLQQFFTK